MQKCFRLTSRQRFDEAQKLRPFLTEWTKTRDKINELVASSKVFIELRSNEYNVVFGTVG